MRPPRLAEALLHALLPSDDRDEVLGDLAEEFSERVMASATQARLWYWRQALRSLPPLALLRLRSDGGRTAGLVVGTCLLGWALTSVWDLYVARQSAYILAAQPNAPSLIVVRVVYFLVLTAGFALVGGAIAQLIFRSRWPFLRNGLVFLGPLSAVVVIVSAMAAVTTQLYVYSAFRATLAVAALASGAYVVARRRRITCASVGSKGRSRRVESASTS